MFYKDDKLIALLPMNEKENVLYSHGGVTYGGMIVSDSMRQPIMQECFSVLLEYSKNHGFKKIIYKTIPYIYHKTPAEEDRFALFSNDARLVTVDVSTYINLKQPIKMNKGRKWSIKKAIKEGVKIQEANELLDYELFISMENEVLTQRHNTRAVHTAKELKLLHDIFPENIHLYAAYKNERMIAGTVVYEYEDVIHTQYMATNDDGRTIGALDLAVSTVIDIYKDKKHWLDFGISTEHNRIYLNEGLVSQKEAFGGSTGVYEIWELLV